MKVVSLTLPDKLVKEIDELIKKDGLYPSRSEFIRHAVMKFLDEYYAKRRMKVELERS